MPTMTPAQRRLAKYRAQAAKWAEKYPDAGKYFDWRTHAHNQCARSYGGTWQPHEHMKRFASPSDRAYYCDDWPNGWRDLGDAHEVYPRGIDHTGWYADGMQHELVRGRVLQLPARHGTPVYIPGTYRTECDGVTLYPLDTYDDKEECARAADGYAEREAEDCREDNAKFQAEQQIESLREDIATCRQTARALIRDIKAHRPQGQIICNVLRAKLLDIREESHKAYKRIAALQDNYWLAVEP